MRIRGYMAMSVDGFIADREGGVAWLDAFSGVDAGYERFIAGVGTIVFGRLTYEQSLGFSAEWPFAGKRSIVVTSKSLRDPPREVESWSSGIDALIGRLRDDPGDGGDAWVIGGAMLQSAFIDAGALDSLDLFVIPVLLGDGVRAFPATKTGTNVRLRSSEALGKGMVRLSYDFSSL